MELAEQLGISRSYACQLRLGRKPLTMRVLTLLHERFSIPGDVLLVSPQAKKREYNNTAQRKHRAEQKKAAKP